MVTFIFYPLSYKLHPLDLYSQTNEVTIWWGQLQVMRDTAGSFQTSELRLWVLRVCFGEPCSFGEVQSQKFRSCTCYFGGSMIEPQSLWHYFGGSNPEPIHNQLFLFMFLQIYSKTFLVLVVLIL